MTATKAVRFDMIFKRKNKEKPIKANREIMTITCIFAALFIALIGYIAYFTAFKSDVFINNTYNNKRAGLLAEKIVRGKILSRDGSLLAVTGEDGEGNEIRNYPYGNLFAHAVGFYSKDNGTIGIEAVTNFKLLTSNDIITERLSNDVNGRKNGGDTIISTLDIGMQEAAFNALGDRKGAVIATDVTTGEILALVSKPDFDPNHIDEIWDLVNEDKDNSPLLNRACQGLYPPGSTFKIVTALEYIKENPDPYGYEFDCTGSFEYEDVKINCYHGQPHGHLDLGSSFARSCNSSFANISSMLDRKSFGETCDTLLFNTDIPCPYSFKQSGIDISGDSDAADVIQAGIGQGKTQITPIHMNMITSAIANDGILMKPMAILEIKNIRGGLVKHYDKKEYARLMSIDEAHALKDLMRGVITNGTGSRLKDTNGYEAAGKTGSAEYSKDKTKSHAWFTGFAPFDSPKIAVTVIVEGGGSGGETAVPIARMVFDEYFHR